jgi:mono/diheme cytochrome c family protein
MIRNFLLGAVLALSACAAPATGPSPAQEWAVDESLVHDGRAIAEAQCARCHAVGEYGDSPNPAAPVFRTLLTRYRAEVLEEELINGIRVAHPMPEFQFNPQGAEALIMYLQYIQERPAAPNQ